MLFLFCEIAMHVYRTYVRSDENVRSPGARVEKVLSLGQDMVESSAESAVMERETEVLDDEKTKSNMIVCTRFRLIIIYVLYIILNNVV